MKFSGRQYPATWRMLWNACAHVPALASLMHRIEDDHRDPDQIARYAQRAGITPGQAKRVLDEFFKW